MSASAYKCHFKDWACCNVSYGGDAIASYKEIKAGINFDSTTGNIEDWVIEE